MRSVRLTPTDLSLAREMARHRKSVSTNVRGVPIDREFVGVMGEMAFSIMTGYPMLWNCRQTVGGYDFLVTGLFDAVQLFERTIDVKTVDKSHHNLLVRKTGNSLPQADIFVLMQVVPCIGVGLVGYQWHHVVCTPEYWDDTQKDPCWNYPRGKLLEWPDDR